MTLPTKGPEMGSPSDTGNSSSTLKRALAAIDQLQRELEAARRGRGEPVAVVGVGCRFPGGVVDADSYWRLLEGGVDAVGEIPPDRWDIDALYDAEPGTPGKMVTRWGGFLDGIDQFDAAFFGISSREAEAMDPNQRLALEVAWEAVEDAGYADLAGSRTGVFVGVVGHDYGIRQFAHPEDVTPYAVTGTAHSIVSGRLAYLLDLRGPAVSVDTACSSSLVAVYLACQSLRAGDCDLALAGGVNVILSPLSTIGFSQWGLMSPTGRCRAFDAGADGMVRGEGCGIVVLKRLSDALKAGDDVLAVIRGGAINQDGRSTGLTAPNVLSQRELLRRALQASGVEAGQVSYVEAHGAATTLGDPIEMDALAEVHPAEPGEEWYLGSVKTNFGHTEAAAGVAGLIKVVLALRHRAIPAHLHFERLSPYLALDRPPFAIPTRLTEWAPRGGRRIAGVSSFGLSGTNVHLLVEEAPARRPAAGDTRRPLSVLALSARSEAGLRALAGRHRDRLGSGAHVPAADHCYSANTGRAHFPHRLAVLGGTARELDAALASALDGPAAPGREPAGGPGAGAGVVFVFSGEGAGHPGVTRALYEAAPAFREALRRCDELLGTGLQVPLLSVLFPPGPGPALLTRPALAQPALFAVEYALAGLWRAWGVEPAAVLGHGMGEIVAACIAGVMSVQDALQLVTERAAIAEALLADGAAAAVFAPEAQVAGVLAGRAGEIAIAAVDGPARTVVSGKRTAVQEVCAALAARGIRTEPRPAVSALHSPLVEPLLAPLRRAAGQIGQAPPRIPFVSGLNGQLWPWQEAPDAGYWCRQARQPVRFAAGITTLRSLGHTRFLEVGPDATLAGLLEGDAGLLAVPSIRAGQDSWRTILGSVAELYSHGTDIDWAGFDRGYARTRVPVPTTPFVRDRHWYDSPRTRAATASRPQTAPAGRPGPAAGAVLTREELLPLAETERLRVLAGHLARGIGAALGAGSGPRRHAGPAINVGLDQPLLDLGLDSLMAMGIKNLIRAQLGVTLPIASLLEGATVRRVAEQVLERLADGETASSQGALSIEDQTDALLAELSSLPEDEARALIGGGRDVDPQ